MKEMKQATRKFLLYRIDKHIEEVLSGAKKSVFETGDFTIKTYWVGDIIRIDIILSKGRDEKK